MLRPFSDHQRGLFVSVDGPSGAGKSTIVAHLAQLLVADGEHVYSTAEPSTGVIGKLARDLTETITGPALACLYSADRYHHIETEIHPRLEAGEVVLCDRYVPSGLVMQRFDGVDPAFLWGLNSTADRPDLAVVLEADPAVIAARLAEHIGCDLLDGAWWFTWPLTDAGTLGPAKDINGAVKVIDRVLAARM